MEVRPGWASRRARKSDSLADFYLAGRGLGVPVLVLTLYATQYSGNSLIGYPGEAYRMGFSWMMTVGFMMAIVVVYLSYAPKLHRISRGLGFVTPADWIEHRFGLAPLTHVANLLLVAAITNYLLAQLIAIGHITAGLTAGAAPYWVGVVAFALIIVIYETVGGLRAVAWTDCIQGLLLLLGLGGLVAAVIHSTGGLGALTEWLAANRPEMTALPDAEHSRYWLSTILLVGFSGAVYPQAIQRIYAARSGQVLRRALRIMIFMPLLTMPVVVLVGLSGVRQWSSGDGLEGIEADQVMPMLLREWSQQGPLFYLVSVLVLLGAVAAIMSTLAGWERLWGFHAGVLGLALNVLVGVTGSLWLARRQHG